MAAIFVDNNPLVDDDSEDEDKRPTFIDLNPLVEEEPPQELPTPEEPQPPKSTELETVQEETTMTDVVEDVARVTAKFPLGALEAAQDIVDTVSLGFRGKETDPEAWSNFARKMVKSGMGAKWGIRLSEEDVNQIVDDHGKIRDVETATGQILNVGAFIGSVVTGKAMFRKGTGFVKEGAKWLTASVGAGQLLADKDANVGNLIESLYEDDTPESTIHTVAEFLSADEDDTEMEKRVKLLGEEVLFTGIFGTIGATKRTVPWLIKKSKEMYNSRPWQLTKEQKGEIAHKYLAETRDNLKIKLRTDPDTPLPLELIDEGGTKILKNADSVTRRFVGRFFTSRGPGLTKKAFNAFEDSKTAQRQVLSRATFISGQLDRALKNITDADKSAAVGQRVQTALHSDIDFLKDLTGEDRLASFAMKHKLPDSVAAHTLEARELIDKLSKDLTTVRMSDNLKEIIQDNAGSYLRTSYRLFEDPNYVPSDDVRNNALDYIAKSMRNADESLDENTALVRAANQVDQILSKGSGKEIYDHIINSKRVAREILGHKKAVPKEIRSLMGEIQDPSENILLTVSKMSKLYETNNFFDKFYTLGKSGKYVVDPDDMPVETAARKGWKEIKGTNSVLDEKWAPSHVVDALQEKDAHFKMFLGKDGTVSPFWRNFLLTKGVSQSMKTVYSHVTHARNFVGGMQFGTANGASPFSRESVENFKILRQEVLKGGDKVLQEKYEEFLKLGIINTNVRVNEFRELLDVGYESTFGNFASKLAGLGNRYGAVKRAKALGKKYIVDAPEDIYMATDDFFKINYYQQELRTLQKAFPDEPISVLKEEASNLVRDTFPNYDRVPRGIQALRELPIGNFMAFPTEIMRTSTHIVRQASKEITSGSPVLRARGLRRLAGFATTTSGWAGASAVSAHLLGWTEEEAKAHQILSETPFSKDAPRIWVTTDDGIKSIDTQFLDSYSVIKEPLMAAYREIETGQLQGEALDEYLVDALKESSWTLLEPYVSQSMLTEAFLDLGYATQDPEGRLPTGKPIFSDKLDAFDQAWAAVSHLGKTMAPGSVISAKQLVDAATGKKHRVTGDTNDTKLTLITQATGFKYTNHEPADEILWAAKKWKGANFNASSLKADYETTGMELVEQHYNIEKNRNKASREFYRKVNASIVAVGLPKTLVALNRAKLSENEIDGILSGYFVPRPLSENLAMEIFEKTPSALEEHEKGAINKLLLNYADMRKTRLDEPFEEVRYRKAIGGIVEDVPQVPKEPDERIDKLTGRPYNEQAGGAFIDAEDPLRRLGFLGGGLADNPIRRLGFGIGGEVLELFLPRLVKTIRTHSKRDISTKEAEQAARNIEDSLNVSDDIDVPSELESNPELEDYVIRLTRSRLDEKNDLSLEQLEKIPEWKAAQEGTGTWQEFSRKRPNKYTEEEIENEALVQGMSREFDPDMGITHTVNTALRSIDALDRPSIEAAERNFEDFWVQKESIGLPEEYLVSTDLKENMKSKLRKEIADLSVDEERMLARIERDMPEVPVRKTLPDEMGPVPKDERMANREDFVRRSEEKGLWYRGTYSGFDVDYEVNFAFPREIGTHVGTRGQATDVVARKADIKRGTDSTKSDEALLTEGKMPPEVADEMFEQAGRADVEGSPYALEHPPAITSGYIRVQKPLVMSDLGNWGAGDVLSNESSLKQIEAALGEQANVTSKQQKIFRTLVKDVDDFYSKQLEPAGVQIVDDKAVRFGLPSEFKRELYEADFNIRLKKFIEDLGFDSIKYKNTGEGRFLGEESFSYILFRPNQFKSRWAQKYDPGDPRQNKVAGGKVYNALRRRRAEGGLEEVSADVENSQGSHEEMSEPKKLYGKDAIAEVVRREGEVTPAQEYVIEHEGYVFGEYLDSKGVPTSGVGQTDEYSGMSFKDTYDIHRDDAKRLVPEFDNLSENQQKALMSLVYRGDLQQSPTFVSLVNEGNFEQAAVELLTHEEYKDLKKTNPTSGIIRRLDEAADLIKQK